jgi:hypothetical protein
LAEADDFSEEKFKLFSNQKPIGKMPVEWSNSIWDEKKMTIAARSVSR